mgnify:CR=1 FL=1
MTKKGVEIALNTSSKVTGKQILELKNMAVQHFTESDWTDLGILTDMLDIVERHPRLLRSLHFGDDDYESNAFYVLKKMIDANPDNYRIVKSFITGEREDSVNISSTDTIGRTISFAPNIFTVPDEEVDGNLVSVMMPFSTELMPVYETIKSAANNVGFNCLRADDIWEDSTIIQDIFSLIFKSYIIVCDFSGKNPNVFYEAGIAHTLGKHVIPLTQSRYDIPFDLQHHRYVQYLNNNEGRKKMETDLIMRFRTLLEKRPDHIKPRSYSESFFPF